MSYHSDGVTVVPDLFQKLAHVLALTMSLVVIAYHACHYPPTNSLLSLLRQPSYVLTIHQSPPQNFLRINAVLGKCDGPGDELEVLIEELLVDLFEEHEVLTYLHHEIRVLIIYHKT